MSQEPYKAVIIEAERFNHDLTLQIGVLSYQCENEEKHLIAVREMIEGWKNDLRSAIKGIFYDRNQPSPSDFQKLF